MFFFRPISFIRMELRGRDEVDVVDDCQPG